MIVNIYKDILTSFSFEEITDEEISEVIHMLSSLNTFFKSTDRTDFFDLPGISNCEFLIREINPHCYIIKKYMFMMNYTIALNKQRMYQKQTEILVDFINYTDYTILDKLNDIYTLYKLDNKSLSKYIQLQRHEGFLETDLRKYI